MNLSPEVSYDEAIRHLFSLEFTGMKLGLDNIKALMDILGNPHRVFPAIHIAGTNGKGSVCNMLAAALQANGYKTGLYTSPHLVSYTERMRIDGIPISEARLTEYFKNLWPHIQEIKATFFEATTAIAFQYFRDENVDVAVIETGLGGRLDATNILERPLVTAVTSIGFEHTEILGNTLEKIAYEKACIFKPGVPAIVNAPDATHQVFIDKANEVGASLTFVQALEIDAHNIPLPGSHQRENYATVMQCLNQLSLPLDRKKAELGIANAPKLTGLRARLEEFAYPRAVKKGVKLFLDVAHNPDGFQRLGEFFSEKGVRPIVIAGFAKDKDVRASLEVIKSFADQFVAVSAQMSRALSIDVLEEQGKNIGLMTVKFPTVMQAISDVISMSKAGSVVLLTGSHYVIGEFLAGIGRENEA